MKMLAIKFKDGWYVSLEELFPLKTEKDVRDLADALGMKLKDTSYLGESSLTGGNK